MSTLPLLPVEAADVRTSSAGKGLLGVVFVVWNKVRSKASYALADQVVYSLGNLVVAALLSRHTPARQFGIYILTQRAMDVLIQLSNVFIWAPFTFHLPDTSEGCERSYQGSVLALQCLLCAVFTAVLWGVDRCLLQVGHEDLHATFAALLIPAAAILFREFTRRMYFAHMRMAEAFWTELVTVALQVAGVFWLMQHGSLTIWKTLLVLGLGAGAVSLWWLAREWQQWQFTFAAMIRDLRQDVKLGRWFFGSNMVFLAGAQCNPWLLNAVLGGASVGSYAICESLVNIPRVALTSMQNVMAPAIARANAEGGRASVRTVVRRMDRSLLSLAVLSAAAICLFGPLAARLLYRSVPPHTRLIAALLALNFVVYASTLAQSYGLSALNRADTTFYANALGLLAQAGACYFLVRRFAIPGAAVALLLGSVVILLARQWFYSSEMAAA